MRKISDSYGVYAEFFTNGAVAWFTAGIITPVFTRPHNLSEFMPSVIAIIGMFVFLNFAQKFTKEEK